MNKEMLIVNEHELELILDGLRQIEYSCLEDCEPKPAGLNEVIEKVKNLVKNIDKAKPRYNLKYKEDVDGLFYTDFEIINGCFKLINGENKFTLDSILWIRDTYNLDLNMFEIIKVDEVNEKESEMKEKEIIDYVLEELEYLESTYHNSIYDYEEEGGDVCDQISDDLKELIDNITNRVGQNAGVNSTPFSFKELQYYILKWAEDKDLLHRENSGKQFMKFIEEVFEFKSEMDMLDNSGESLRTINLEHVKDEMGDIFVTLIILCEQLGIDPVECLELAYNKIKKRKGKTINGQFVKEEDL